MNRYSCFHGVLLILLSSSALAQSSSVLRGQDITESALIEALTPAPMASDPPVLTRSIRVSPRTDTPKDGGKPASASLLITFETNSAALTPQAKKSLNVVGEALSSEKLADYQFAIEGHADPRGDSNWNLQLSRMRADTVRQYLVQNKRIESERLRASGKGDSELMNRADPAAPENRRVKIITLTR